MFGLIKIAGVSAVLSAGFVSAYAPAPAPGGKLYQDRIAQVDEASAPMIHTVAYATREDVSAGSSGRQASLQGCAAQTWPNVAPECLSAANGTPARVAVRTITIEKREAENTSTLVRVPTDGARR